MDFLAPVKRALGLGDDAEGATYVCIRCGATFERDYRDCPECGKPYVALDE
jgi:rubrerythrin